MSKTEGKSSLLKDALILFAITLIASLALGLVYEITREPIANAKEQAKLEAYKKVFPEMDYLKEAESREIDTVNEAVASDAALKGSKLTALCRAYDVYGNELGYVMSLSNSGGYGGDITAALGISADGTLKGLEFLSLSETAGLGMRAKEDSFTAQFKDVNTDAFSLPKAGIEGETELDAISSATITSAAVSRLVNAGLAAFRMLNGGEVQ